MKTKTIKQVAKQRSLANLSPVDKIKLAKDITDGGEAYDQIQSLLDQDRVPSKLYDKELIKAEILKLYNETIKPNIKLACLKLLLDHTEENQTNMGEVLQQFRNALQINNQCEPTHGNLHKTQEESENTRRPMEE